MNIRNRAAIFQGFGAPEERKDEQRSDRFKDAAKWRRVRAILALWQAGE
jgi:hypothetical protein